MKTQKRNLRTLAEAVGYTPAMMSHIVNAIRSPSLECAIKLNKVTGISIATWASKDSERITAAVAKWSRAGKGRS